MPILFAVGTLGVSQTRWIVKILFPSLLYPRLSHSGRMNQSGFLACCWAKTWVCLSILLSFRSFLFAPFLLPPPGPCSKTPYLPPPPNRRWVSGPFPSFCNFLLMSGAAWVMKECALTGQLPSMIFRSVLVKFLKASVSLPKEELGSHSSSV